MRGAAEQPGWCRRGGDLAGGGVALFVVAGVGRAKSVLCRLAAALVVAAATYVWRRGLVDLGLSASLRVKVLLAAVVAWCGGAGQC